MVDIVAVAAQTAAAGLRTCDGCDAKFARGLGADYSIVGWARKVSNLILNMNIAVRDAGSGQLLAIKSVDIRGNTNESRSRALDWLVRYELLAPKGIFR